MKNKIAKRAAALAVFIIVMLVALYLLQKLMMPKYMSDIPEGGHGRGVLSGNDRP